ncbi:MAG: peptide chain release factor N(5)-glutamine methyltransferase [Burkholderiales bacterium]
MPTAGELLAASRLPRNEAAMLLAAACGVDRVVFVAYPERTVLADAAARFTDWSARRLSGEPIAYLLGTREFYGLALRVDHSVLIPRPETELLVDLALERIGRPGVTVLDLGTGSGAIAIAIARHRPTAIVHAVDASAAALATARDNAASHRVAVEFIESDWFDALGSATFDLVVANPPYIASADPHLREGDLRFEPVTALASGADGLDAIRRIVRDAPSHLAAGGVLAIEHGYDQGASVRALFVDQGFSAVESRRDLAGHDRITSGVGAS